MTPALAYAMPTEDAPSYDRPMRCNRAALAELIQNQWKRITRERMEHARYGKHALARLIEEEYGIHYTLAENYLSNLERSLPLNG